MISKLSTAIRLNSISLDPVALDLFSTNVSTFYSSIDTLTRAYKLIPDDLSNYDNVVKAMGGINSKIAEIQNLETFNAEQQALEKYIITLNSLDLTKVKALSDLMSVMNELATKLGALDNFTEVLNKKLSTTLSNLAKQIKDSGDIINKADNLQKQRHEAIKASIKEIQNIMDKSLIVEVNHREIQQSVADYGGGAELGGSADQGMFGGGATPNLFGGEHGFNSHTGGGIDYGQLKLIISQAISENKSKLPGNEQP